MLYPGIIRRMLFVNGDDLSPSNPLPVTGIGVTPMANVGGFGAVVQATPPVTVGSYSYGMVIGTLMTFANAARSSGGSGMVQLASVGLISGAVPTQLDLVLFDANPTASTIADRGALVVATADLPKVIGVAHMNDVTLLGPTAPSFVQTIQLAMPFKLPVAGTSLFAALVSRTTATFSLTTTNNVTVTLRLIQD